MLIILTSLSLVLGIIIGLLMRSPKLLYSPYKLESRIPENPLEKTRNKIRSGAAINVVAFGDSISTVNDKGTPYAGGASAPEGNWHRRLGVLLKEAFPDARFNMFNFGRGGHNTYEGLGRIEWLADHQPDLVLCAFGSNDALNWHPLPSSATERALTHMIDWIRARYHAEVFLVLPGGAPPQDRQSKRVATISAVIRRVAIRMNVPFAEVRPEILRATKDGKDWPVFHDGWGVHPNDQGHAVWARTVFESLRKFL